MPKYRISLRRIWIEHGEFEADADSPHDASDLGYGAMADDDTSIKWQDKEPGDQFVDGVREVKP